MKSDVEQIVYPVNEVHEAVDYGEEPLVLTDEQTAFRNNFLAKTVGYVAAEALIHTPDVVEEYFAYIDELLIRPPESCAHLLPEDKTQLMEMQGFAYLGLDAWSAFYYSGIPRREYNRRLDLLASYVRTCHETISLPEHIIPHDGRIAREALVTNRLKEMEVSERNRELVLALHGGLKTRSQLMAEYDLSRPGLGWVVRQVISAMKEQYGHDDKPTIDFATDIAKQRDKSAAGGRQKQKIRPTEEGKKSLLLKAEEEVELAKDIEAGLYADYKLGQNEEMPADYIADLQALKEKGDAAFTRFAKANEGLVRYFIRMKRSTIEGGGIEDIYSIADVVTEKGLMHAIRKFDYKLGYKFSTYACNWIKSAIDRAVANRQPITIGVHAYGLMRRLVAHRYMTHKETGYQMSNAELAEFFNVKEKRVADLLITHEMIKGARGGSLQAPLREKGGGESKKVREDITADSSQPTDDDVLLRMGLEKAISTLNVQQRFLLEHRFGLGGKKVLPDAEVAEILKISVSKVRVLRKKAMTLVRFHVETVEP